MYKLILCWRYLCTRYLALASVISVMLGVATLIVVNSVMGGFSTKLMVRMQGLHSDIIIEHRSQDGMAYVAARMEQVKQKLGDKLVAITPVIDTFAILEFNVRRYGDVITKPVRVIGVDPAERSKTGEFKNALRNPEHREDPAKAFSLHGKALETFRQGYGVAPAPQGFGSGPAPLPPPGSSPAAQDAPPAAPGASPPHGGGSPFDSIPAPAAAKPPEEFAKPYGAVVGYGIATYRRQDAHANDPDKDIEIISPGHEISLTLLGSTTPEGYNGPSRRLRPTMAKFVVTDLFRCEMAEIDSMVVFIDLKDMQTLRAMGNHATTLHLKLKDFEKDAAEVVKLLRGEGQPAGAALFPPGEFLVQTWKDRQGALLSAIAIERAILNVLLFLIIAVAGFGILAIFYMIVVEKTKDIGILKALGAPSGGIMNLFMGYGLILGVVGAGLGTALGVAITVYINEIEKVITALTSREVFPRDIYYFDSIPTDLSPWMVLWVNLGSVAIALGASVLPAMRAAALRPVEALRYE